jgi:methionyl-tRNA formyltransferase
VWSIIEGTPAGATIHYLDEGIDTGDIIAQSEVPVEAIDTGASLYSRLEECCIELFQNTWPAIRSGTAPRTPQTRQAGTAHRTSDVERIDRIDLDRSYNARELINVLRARTFPPYSGAYFIEQGRRVGLRLQLEYEDDDES